MYDKLMIQPKSRSIDDIFSDGQNRIIVPPYQRNFDWGKNEVQEWKQTSSLGSVLE